MLGLARPHSTTIWRVRVISLAVAIGFAVLAIASPLITALTIGNGEPLPWLEAAIFAAVWIAGTAYCVTYVAERREIAYRVAREEAAQTEAQG